MQTGFAELFLIVWIPKLLSMLSSLGINLSLIYQGDAVTVFGSVPFARIVHFYICFLNGLFYHTVLLNGNVALARHSQANVEQTYLSTLTAHRSRNRSDNRKLCHRIQLCRQILSTSVISSFESSISCTCSILDTTLETKLRNSHNS